MLDLPGTGPLDPIRRGLSSVFRPVRAAGNAVFEPLGNGWKGAFNYGEVEDQETALCARVGLPPRSLADCPYSLIGSPERLAERVCELEERVGLDWLIVPLAAIDRFAADVVPLLA